MSGNLQPTPALPAQLKIRRIFLAAGWAVHVANRHRCIFVGFNHMFAARIVFVALDPYFRVGVRKGDFSGYALRVLVKNLRRNVGVFEQIKYYLRFHQIAGGINFFHAVMSTQQINRLTDKNYVVQKYTSLSYYQWKYNPG